MTVPLSPSQHDSPALDDGCSSVRVAVRARPLVEKEIVEKCKECVSYSQDGKQVVLGKDRRFTFDHVFGPTISQEDVYIDCVKPLVESCCAGLVNVLRHVCLDTLLNLSDLDSLVFLSEFG